MIVQFLDYQDLPWSLLIILSSLFITLPPGGGEQSREVGKSTSRRRHCLWTWLLYFLGLGEKGREGRWWNEWRDLPRPHFFSLFFPNHFCFPILLPIFHPAVSFRPLWNCLGPGLRMRKTHWSLPCLGNDYSPRGRGGGRTWAWVLPSDAADASAPSAPRWRSKPGSWRCKEKNWFLRGKPVLTNSSSPCYTRKDVPLRHSPTLDTSKRQTGAPERT